MSMRVLISSALLFAVSSSLCMAAPTGDYLKEKKQAAAQVNKLGSPAPTDASAQNDAKALEQLQTTLRKLIPQHHLKDFPAQGKITIESLGQGNTGSGGLDGLLYTTADSQKHLIVSTKPLLTAWLDTYRKSVRLPKDLAGTFSTDAFYAGAINNGDSDAVNNAVTVTKYANLPVKSAKTGIVTRAILFKQGDGDTAPEAPDRIGVALSQGDAVYVLWQSAKAPDIAACRKSYDPETSEEGNFEACYAKQLPAQDGYQALVKQAQDIVDELSAQ